MHAIGDRATREALDNFQAARDANGARDLRHTITHLQAIDAADIARFPALGVVASMSLQWARRDGYSVDNTEGYIDDALYQRLYPAAELWRAGAIVAGGSDYPVDPLLPMVQIETAIDHTGEAMPGVYPGALSPARSCRPAGRDQDAHDQQRLPDAHGAGHGLDRGRQVRRPGRPQPEPVRGPDRADLETRVLQTFLGGKLVYSAPATAPSRRAISGRLVAPRQVDTRRPPTYNFAPFVDRPSAAIPTGPPLEIPQRAAAGRPGASRVRDLESKTACQPSTN